MKTLLFILGSQRSGSFNKQLAEEVEKIIDGRAEIKYLDYSNVPFFNQEIEYPAPETVTEVRRQIAEADALWIFTPEYNYSYPGILKNLIDWISRPLTPGDRETPLAINGKKVTISGAGGNGATEECREKLTDLLELPFINADMMSAPQTGIAVNPEAWKTGKVIFSETQLHMLTAQVESVLLELE